MSRTSHKAHSSNILLKIEPTRSSVLPYILGSVFGILLIIFTVSFDLKFNSLYYYIVLMVVVFYLIIDNGFRQRSSIRLIELDEKSLSVYKGKKMRLESIQLSNINIVSSRKRLFNISVILKLESTPKKKESTYTISSDQIRNAELLKLSEEIMRLKGI
jgi:hypothetical protein